jgi:hypothetical protein
VLCCCVGSEGLRPDKNWFMLSLKFPRQKIVKGDFLNRDGDFRACGLRGGSNSVQVQDHRLLHTGFVLQNKMRCFAYS